MSLEGYFSDLLQLEPLGTSDAQAAQNASIDSQLSSMNQADFESGQLTTQEFNQANADLGSDEAANNLSQIGSAFNQSVQSSLQSASKAVGQIGGAAASDAGTALGNALSQFLSGLNLTTWVMLIAALWIFVEFGGMKILVQGTTRKLLK